MADISPTPFRSVSGTVLQIPGRTPSSYRSVPVEIVTAVYRADESRGLLLSVKLQITVGRGATMTGCVVPVVPGLVAVAVRTTGFALVVVVAVVVAIPGVVVDISEDVQSLGFMTK